MTINYDLIKATDWTRIQDDIDLTVWNRSNTNHWLPEKIPLSSDVPDYREKMSEDEKRVLKLVFASLTRLDTLQGFMGAPSMLQDALTPHEEAVLCQFAYMECVHARSYSSVFATLCSSEEIAEAFEWANTNPLVDYKIKRIQEFYENSKYTFEKKSASVILESFLFYAGFFAPLYWASRQKMMQTSNIISLILRDEATHGFYLGYKYQQSIKELGLSAKEQDEIRDNVYELITDLMENEEKYSELLYDSLGLTKDVKAFLKYNANKALMNLGYEALFPADLCKFDTAVLASLDPTGNQNSDFFSMSGSSYRLVDASDDMDDEDWDF